MGLLRIDHVQITVPRNCHEWFAAVVDVGKSAQ
jgi:hypothetical protein